MKKKCFVLWVILSILAGSMIRYNKLRKFQK